MTAVHSCNVETPFLFSFCLKFTRGCPVFETIPHISSQKYSGSCFVAYKYQVVYRRALLIRGILFTREIIGGDR